MRHSLDDVFYGIEALKTRYDPVEEECFDDPSTPKEPVDYEALDKGMEALEFEAEAIQTKADLASTCLDEMIAYQGYIKNYGADRAVLSLLNRNNRFANYLNVTLPSCESMSNIGSPYSELSLVCMEGIGKTIGKFFKVLWKTIKAVFKWITTPFRALWKKIKEAWKEVDVDNSHLSTKSEIKKVIKALVESTGDVIKKYNKKKKFDADAFRDHVKSDLKDILNETMYYVENDAKNDELAKAADGASAAALAMLKQVKPALDKLTATSNIQEIQSQSDTLSGTNGSNYEKLLGNDKNPTPWSKEKTKIIVSTPNESTYVLLNIKKGKAAIENTTKAIDDLIKNTDEQLKKLDTLINKSSATPQTQSQQQGSSPTGSSSPQEAFNGVKEKILKIKDASAFVSQCYGDTAKNGLICKKYNTIIAHMLEEVLNDYDIKGADNVNALNELKEAYHKKISFYHNNNAPTGD